MNTFLLDPAGQEESLETRGKEQEGQVQLEQAEEWKEKSDRGETTDKYNSIYNTIKQSRNAKITSKFHLFLRR